MKLVSFRTPENPDRLGVVRDAVVVPVTAALDDGTPVDSSRTYIARFPESAAAVARWAGSAEATVPLESVTLNPPVAEVRALMDCGVAPRHLQQAAVTLFTRSLPGALRTIARPVVDVVSKRVLSRALADNVVYDFRRATAAAGDGVLIPWPSYTSFLDIEPELAIITAEIAQGADAQTVAAAIIGYTIMNDVSARDVQLSEMVGAGMAASKDMDHGNVLGPWLVTPDELTDPMNLEVVVSTDRGRRWVGTTADYSMSPVELVVGLAKKQSIAAGTVIGMGTVADTCGLERDEWLEPGEVIDISFEGIGTLHQTLGAAPDLDTTRWGGRPALAHRSSSV